MSFKVFKEDGSRGIYWGTPVSMNKTTVKLGLA